MAGDILASHLLPQPRTPEGLKIRLGGGVAPVMAGLSLVGLDAVAVDRALLTWLAAGVATSVVADAAIGYARHATVSLPPVLEDVIANAPAGPRLLDSLTITTSTGTTPTDIDTPIDASEGLRQARIWLWQNPDQVQAIHLRLGTETGVAVSRRAHATAGPTRPAGMVEGRRIRRRHRRHRTHRPSRQRREHPRHDPDVDPGPHVARRHGARRPDSRPTGARRIPVGRSNLRDRPR